MMTFTELESHCGGVDTLHDSMFTILKLFLNSHSLKPHPKKAKRRAANDQMTLS